MLTQEVWSDHNIYIEQKVQNVEKGNIFTGRECRYGTRLDLKKKCRIVSSPLILNRPTFDLVFVLIFFFFKDR